MNLDQAVVYDVETLPNVFTLDAELLHQDVQSVWEISDRRNDVQQLIQWFNWLHQTQTAMIGFNNEAFDYRIVHEIMNNPNITAYELYLLKERMFNSSNRFEFTIWPNERFAPQIDLYKIHHFDNKAKTTSLKALQINMRSKNVSDPLGLEIDFHANLTDQQIDQILIPYNRHDTSETKRFAHYSMPAINFRIGLINDRLGDVLNFNDTKIGAKILEKRLGEDICYTRQNGRKMKRQTPRSAIALNDIIFPYVHFENPEFNRVLQWMKTQTLTSDDIQNPEETIKTKGVFSKVKANVGGLEFHFGTGGIHGSVSAQKIIATDELLIEDIDVKALYPSIAIVNGLFPEHLGEVFVKEYARLPEERAEWQVKKGAKCVEANSMKLAGNGTYGNSNSKFSIFYDPKFTMTITINGQLMLCMLAEWLTKVPTLQFIQINTDGITYRIHKDMVPIAKEICERWEKFTLLKLESAHYSRMWIRDVNNYVAESVSKPGQNEPPKMKQKGAYWHPDPLDYANSISTAGPPAWHKDFNPVIVTKAAVAAMVHGVDPEAFIRAQSDPYDFMCRVKVDKASKLMLGARQIQSTTRYYIATNGAEMKKISPPAKGAVIGTFKRKSGITDHFYKSVLETGTGAWDERIHTKNKSTYQIREMAVNAGWKVAECNRASDFDFNNINYDWYVNEAKKLIIG